MKLVKRDEKGLLRPWMQWPSIFDEDWFEELSPKSGMNMWESDDYCYVEVAVPGMKEKDVDVNLENGVLTIRAAKEEKEEEKKGKRRVYASSMKSSYSYSTSLPSNVDVNSVEAELEDGVLVVKIAKSEAAKPKKIQVKRKAGK